MKGSLAKVEDTFMCKVCKRALAGDGEDKCIDKNMDLEMGTYGVHLEIVRMFCCLGDIPNEGGGANWHLWQGCVVCGGSLNSCWGS